MPCKWVDINTIHEFDSGWKRFQYEVNGHLHYIYCRTQNVFLKLFESWKYTASLMYNLNSPQYIFAIRDEDGVPISLEDIIMDSPDGTHHYPKMYIASQQGEFIQ